MSSKISAVADGVTANTSDDIVVNRSGLNKRITPGYINTYVATNGLGLVARARLASNHTATASIETRPNFATVDYDRDSAITTGASWVYTAPAAGEYKVELFDIYVDKNGSNWLVDTYIEWYLYRGSSFMYTIAGLALPALTRSYLILNGSGIVTLTAAQTCHVRFGNGTASDRKVSTGGQIAISRVR